MILAILAGIYSTGFPLEPESIDGCCRRSTDFDAAFPTQILFAGDPAQNDDKFDAVQKSLLNCKSYLETIEDKQTSYEIGKYERLWDLDTFKNLEEDNIKSTGYVVDTLEAAIWCFLNTDSYKECVLKAVNLGNDTDTVGAVAGGVAGLYYELKEIPAEWIELLPKKEWIIELAKQMKRN